MNISKIFSAFFIVLFLSSINFYGQDICTNYTVTPGTAISSSGAGAIYNSIINVPDSYTITDVNVTVNITHTYNADLDIYIISPSGTTIELSTDNGGSGDNYNNVTFDDASANTLPTGSTTISGTYQPEGSLAGLNGQNSNGNWTLRIIDDANGDGGTINNIILNLCYTPIPANCTNYTVTPGTAISSGGGAIYNSVINVPDSYTITDVDVTVNITHTYNADLDIYIISPSGTTIELSTDNGGSGDNYNNVTFDDASANILPTGNTTLSGTYQPEGSLAGLNGENSNGNWTLRVIDDANGDGGTIISITLQLCYTQPTVSGYLGPGGVGNTDGTSALKLWLDASNGVTLTGTSLTGWYDQSGYTNNALPSNTGARPTLVTADINGYPSVNFDGVNDELRVANDASLNLTSWDIFVATKANTNKNYNAIFVKGQDAFENYEFLTYDTGEFHTPIKMTDGSRTFSNSATGFYSTTNFDAYEYSFSSAVGRDVYKNATNIITDDDNKTPQTNSQSLYIGNENGTTGRFLNGRISELILYNTPLNTAQKIIVNNYLSAKYNTPLTTDDIYTRDNAGAGDFDHNVAGIGQASDGSNHTDSQGTGIVRISNPGNLNNNDFLFWGEETKNPTYNFSTNPSNYTEQLNSRWRVNRRGNLGTVTVSFDISGIDLSGKQTCSELQLVIDNTYDFSSPTNVYNLTISGSTAIATGVTFANNRYFTLRYTDQIVWDSPNFFNGSGAGNAPNNADSCLKLTVKNGGSGTLINNAHVREVEVEAGGMLNVADGILLEVDNQVVINGTIDLLGEAQLIQNHTGTTSNSGSGSLFKRQQGTANLHNYNYWSSPVNRGGYWQIGNLEDATGVVNFTTNVDANPLTAPITLSSRWLYSFKGPANDYNAWSKLTPSSNISPGIGYSMKGSGAATSEQEFIFKGLPNDGDYTFPVAINTEFLVGNPYPSTLDSFQFILDNLLVIDGTLHFWESFTTNNSHYLADYEGGYATLTLLLSLPAVADLSGLTSGLGIPSKPLPTRYIGVGQGFFVKTLLGGNLRFQNSQRAFARESLSETVYYKTNTKNKQATLEDNRPKLWFSFTSSKNYQKTIGLGYDNNTTYGYDRGYDAKPYDNLKDDVYWLQQDNEKLIIQGLPEINTEDNLQLGINVTNAGLYKFSISKMENIPDDLNIYLVDNNQNIYYDLRNGEAQLFLNTGNGQHQFSIVFKDENTLGTKTVEKQNMFTTYDTNTKILELHFKEPMADIENIKIYNTLGQEVMDMKLPNPNRINLSHLPDSVYILKLKSKTSNTLKSIKFVKY